MFSFHKFDIWEVADYELARKEYQNRQRKKTESECSERNEETSRLTEGGDGDMSPPQDDDNLSGEYQEMPPPPDGGYGWVIVLASFLCNMIVDGIAYTFGIFLGKFVEYYGEGKGKTAWVGSLLSGTYLSVGPLVSALTNKYGCRKVCILGSFVGCMAFALSTISPNVNTLMLTYGVMGGIGFGMIYLPAVVCVGYYFETKRSLATGLAVCGSGFGTFVFAPLANLLLDNFDWKGANLILAGLILNCAIFGALMRPLEFPKEGEGPKPLLLRMADEKRFQMERGSIGGSYFIVQLPDGTMEKRMKMPINIDPGVHSSFNLDQLVPGTPITPVPTMAVLPTITEAKVTEQSGSSGNSDNESAPDLKAVAAAKTKKKTEDKKPEDELKETRQKKTSLTEFQNRQAGAIPRNASQPAFTTSAQGLPKNGSVPFFDRIRKTSQGDRYKPSLQMRVSRGNMNSNGDVRKSLHLRLSNASVMGSKNNNSDDMATSKIDMDNESVNFTMSRVSIQTRKELVRPMSRKDIFYSGSVCNLPEYQTSQRSLATYRQSILSIPQYSSNRVNDVERAEPELCSCLPDSISYVLSSMLDYSLLKNPVFLLIGISNVFGMAGLYVPFVYLVEAATEGSAKIEEHNASFLLSIIGITNTVGRVLCGWIADFPWVNSLLLNNLSLVVTTAAVFYFPLCTTYAQFVMTAVIFGLAISAYISLTSIILVDLLGLDKLTNAFGLLILFRGAATIVGSPMAGMLYDATLSYTYPFFMASGFFLLATVSSFIAPLLKSCAPQEEPPVIMDALTPIDEEEDDEDEEGSNIPEIVETAPSPVGGQPAKPSIIEIKQLESVL